jgi:hypothetical protein
LPDGKKVPFWVNFGGSYNGRFWYFLWPFAIFYGQLVNFVDIWHIFSRLDMSYQLRSGNPGREIESRQV